MARLTQWLLIGGPGHGETLWTDSATVYYPGKCLENYLYTGNDYVHDGKLYRIGVHNAVSEQMSAIPELINKTKLQALQ